MFKKELVIYLVLCTLPVVTYFLGKSSTPKPEKVEVIKYVDVIKTQYVEVKENRLDKVNRTTKTKITSASGDVTETEITENSIAESNTQIDQFLSEKLKQSEHVKVEYLSFKNILELEYIHFRDKKYSIAGLINLNYGRLLSDTDYFRLYGKLGLGMEYDYSNPSQYSKPASINGGVILQY